jgi:hypothetical protein
MSGMHHCIEKQFIKACKNPCFSYHDMPWQQISPIRLLRRAYVSIFTISQMDIFCLIYQKFQVIAMSRKRNTLTCKTEMIYHAHDRWSETPRTGLKAARRKEGDF